MTKTCTWIGEGEGCTEQALNGRSYCEQHLWLVYQRGTAVHRRKDTRTAGSVRDWENLFNEAVEELEQEGAI